MDNDTSDDDNSASQDDLTEKFGIFAAPDCVEAAGLDAPLAPPLAVARPSSAARLRTPESRIGSAIAPLFAGAQRARARAGASSCSASHSL